DTHIRGTTPKNRKDNLPEALIKKYNEIGEIVKEYDIDFILHGGDLFDRADVSISVISNFSSIINKYEVPIYIVSGNHDTYGHNPNTIGRTILGLLDVLGIVRLVNQNEAIYLKKGG